MAYVIEPWLSRDSERTAQDDNSSSSRLALVSDMPESVDDSSQGLALFVLFTLAVLIVTGAVALLALVTSWWVLGLAFAVHVLFTVIVGTAVFMVLGAGRPPFRRDDRARLEAAAGRAELDQSRTSPPIAA